MRDFIVLFVIIVLMVVFAWSYNALYRSLKDMIEEDQKKNEM